MGRDNRCNIGDNFRKGILCSRQMTTPDQYIQVTFRFVRRDGRSFGVRTARIQTRPPLYAFFRHRGHRERDAQDLTQAFFAKLLEKDWLTVADPSRGRFRSFLLMALKRFLANEHEYAQAQKRGGGLQIIPIDFGEEAQFADPKGRTPESIFDR